MVIPQTCNAHTMMTENFNESTLVVKHVLYLATAIHLLKLQPGVRASQPPVM